MVEAMRIISLHGEDPEIKREEIRAYFHNTYDLYESLFEVLANDEAFYTRADPLRHPLIFYYGHTAVFFINKLIVAGILNERIDPKLESIFAVGVDEMSWDDLNEKHYDWPGVEETKRYRDRVREVVDGVISSLPLTLPIEWESPWWAVLMGCEHERIHIETSSVLIRQLPIDLVRPHPRWPICQESADAPENGLVDLPGGRVVLGKAYEDDYYGWDNEYGRKEREVGDFKAGRYLVSNGEYLKFVEEGGYERERYWSEEGWGWRSYEEAQHPRFWIKTQSGYRLRMMAEIVPLPLNHPVEVNYHEAKAFCNWLGEKRGKKLRLPSEEEWKRMVDFSGVPDHPQWGEKPPGNIDLACFASTMPVDRFRHGEFYDLIGNVWQWSETPIHPYEGFRVHSWYDDFTVPTFDGKHNLIKGGSWISTGNEAMLCARYAFRRHFYQHAGFRYVESEAEVERVENVYETDALISQYAEFGWGERYFDVPNYPAACAKLAIEAMENRPKRRALDVGCAIGRSSFELAWAFDEVTGLDFTARFIRMATRMKEEGHIGYTRIIEGEISEPAEHYLHEFGLEETAGKVAFWQADACNLKPIYKGYDLIFAGNLIDRLYSPRRFLEDLAWRLNERGVLILTSPYTWQEAFTPKEEWIGGFKKDGENVTTLEGLREILGRSFRLLETKEVPFVIRETARKYQHTIAQMSIWEKR